MERATFFWMGSLLNQPQLFHKMGLWVCLNLWTFSFLLSAQNIPPTFPDEAYGPNHSEPTLGKGHMNGSNQLFDVYSPEGVGFFPYYVFFHGGAGKIGDKRGDKGVFNPTLVKGLLDHKIGIISGNYPLNDYGHIRENMIQMLNYVKVNAKKYKLDVDQIFLGGDSTGTQETMKVVYLDRYPGIRGIWTARFAGDIEHMKIADEAIRSMGIPCVAINDASFKEDRFKKSPHSSRKTFGYALANHGQGFDSIFIGGKKHWFDGFLNPSDADEYTDCWHNGEWIRGGPEQANRKDFSPPNLADWIMQHLHSSQKTKQTPSPEA